MKITDDYIDDLTRRAAERYPLKIKFADWKKLLALFKVSKDSGITNTYTIKRKSL